MISKKLFMESIGDLSPTGILILTTITIVSSMSQFGNSSSAFEQLYDNCLSFSPSYLCDFFFGKTSTSNMSNSTYLSNFSALTYNDKDHGFIIQYPLGWTTDQGDKEFSTVLRFVSAQNDAGADIRIFPKGGYKTIYDYGDTFNESNTEYKLLNYYRNSSTTLSDRPAIKAIYLTNENASIVGNTYGNKSFTLKEMMVATMVPERESIYAIAYFSNSANFDNYVPVIEKMIDSFKIY